MTATKGKNLSARITRSTADDPADVVKVVGSQLYTPPTMATATATPVMGTSGGGKDPPL